jgi:TATA-box binding protein (TBP) (component of TFIID and TFIIIB)
VGAVSLKATLNCEAFANAHRASSHYDQSSFVGLAWRPEGESCCVEIYSTGRANLPGSRTERALNASFYRMLPELLRFSSAHQLLDHIHEAVQMVHTTSQSMLAVTAPVVAPVPQPVVQAEQSDDEDQPDDNQPDDEIDDAMLGALGL